MAASASNVAAAGSAPTIAVLAVQGAFLEHERRLAKLGCNVFELRQAHDLEAHFDALVLPGGESTVQSKLLRDLGMFHPLRARIEAGMPVLATCAGMVLLAQEVVGAGDADGLDSSLLMERCEVDGFRTLPITVERNSYGRQLASFHAKGVCSIGRDEDGGKCEIPMTFIRAPRITGFGLAVEVIARFDGSPVAVRFAHQLACAFHPELDGDDTIYRAFLDMVHKNVNEGL